jgi:dTDP-4-dehydrorhamnose reductase
MKAVIIGKNGQVAWELMQTVPENVQAIALGREDINILDIKQLKVKFEKFRPDVIINASAYTEVDKAESDQCMAYAINKDAVKNMALVCNQLDIRLLHISTDFVFDGMKNTAYTVDDETNPISVYGASKLAGEDEIRAHHIVNSAIIRTSWVYSSYGNNFVNTMLRLLNEKEEIGVVADQIGCPTYARGLAEFLWQLAEDKDIKPLYNWSDLGLASWYDFANEVQRQAYDLGILSKKIPIRPISTSAYPTLAKRPVFGVLLQCNLDNSNYRRHWVDGLKEALRYL